MFLGLEWYWWLVLLAALLIGLIGARPLYNLYREITFSWTEHSEA